MKKTTEKKFRKPRHLICDKKIGIKLPTNLYEEIKKRHPYDFSKRMREHFEKILSKENEYYKKFELCFYCGNKNKVKIDEFFVALYFPYVKDNKSASIFFICPHCKKNLEDSFEKNRKLLIQYDKQREDDKAADSFLKVIISYLLRDAELGCAKIFAKLCLTFPDNYTLKPKGNILMNLEKAEDFEKQLQILNNEDNSNL